MQPATRVLTVGHSARALVELIALLRAHSIEMLVDVRTLLRSRRHPQAHGPFSAAGARAQALDELVGTVR